MVDLANATCTYCDAPATKSVKTPKGGVVTVCAAHLSQAKARVANTKGPKAKGKTKDLSNPFPTKVRQKLASKGEALPDGSYPIRNLDDLKNAIRAIGRAKDPAKAKAHIIKRAKALGAKGLLPETWDFSNDEWSHMIDLAYVVDLAMTKDGRKSYKRQGKWGHGFVPLDAKARESKAKGSPIAMKRVNRLYGKASRGQSDIKDKSLTASRKGSDTESTSTGRAATSRRAYTADSNLHQRLDQRLNDVERSKGGGRSARAFKPWNEIKEADKVIKNGKKYVKTVYNGKVSLVEWVGNPNLVETSDASKRKMSSVSERDAMQMSTAQIRRLLRKQNQPPAVKKVLNRALRKKSAKAKPRIEKF